MQLITGQHYNVLVLIFQRLPSDPGLFVIQLHAVTSFGSFLQELHCNPANVARQV